MLFNIEFYESANKRIYVKEFLEALKKTNTDLYDWTLSRINLIKNSDFHKEPTSKPLGKGLYELKISFSRDTCRIYWCKGGKRKIYLLFGHIKKGKKKQDKEIKKARKLLNEIKERKII